MESLNVIKECSFIQVLCVPYILQDFKIILILQISKEILVNLLIYLFGLDKKRRKDSKEERKKSRDEPGTSGSSEKPKYFDEIEKDEVVTTDVSMKDIQKMAKKYDKKKTTVDKTGKDGISFGEV